MAEDVSESIPCIKLEDMSTENGYEGKRQLEGRWEYMTCSEQLGMEE